MFIIGFLVFPLTCFLVLVAFCLLEHLGIIPAKVNVFLGDAVLRFVMKADDIGYGVAKGIWRVVLFLRGVK